MKLSQLVDYINQLDTLDYESSCVEASRKLLAAVYIANNHEISFPVHQGELDQRMFEINQSIDQFRASIDSIKKYIQQLIRQTEVAMLQDSARLHDNEMRYDTNQYILNRKLPADPESNILLRSRIRNLGDWRLPGMILRPGTESFIEDMVPLDPLYLVDQHEELLAPSVNKFTPEYQRRLRTYVIDDFKTSDIFEQLPKNQFGFVLAYNYFNYKPIHIFRRYLLEMIHLLRPGGTAILTFNDCDRAHAVALAERNFMCYTPGRMVKQYCQEAGFEIVNHHRGQGDLTWIELRRPGDISSLKGGQSLAKIIAISNKSSI
jgi:SAM-dependent methyltransferase